MKKLDTASVHNNYFLVIIYPKIKEEMFITVLMGLINKEVGSLRIL